MLDVINAGSVELSLRGGDRGILLNCWNKSSPLIQELERTVNFAERKCGDLMQELHFYKEYYEKWAHFERENCACHKKRIKECCRQTAPDFGGSSENELEKANQYLYKKIKSKIHEMNNEISRANRNIQSKSEEMAIEAEPQENLQFKNGWEDGCEPPLSSVIEKKICKSEPAMTSCDVKKADAGPIKLRRKQSSESVPIRIKIPKYRKKEFRPCKKKSGNLQRFGIRSKSLPQGVRRRFGFGGFFEVFEPEVVKSRSRSRTSVKMRSFRSCESKTGSVECGFTPKSSKHRAVLLESDERQFCGNEKSEWEMVPHKTKCDSRQGPKGTEKKVNRCTAVVPSKNVQKVEAELTSTHNLRNLIAKPNALLPFLRHPIPFIPCSSTTKSFNLGLNVQQVLSLIKCKRHSVTLQAIIRNGVQAARSMTEPSVNTLFVGQTALAHSQAAICPAREGSEYSFSTVTDDRPKCTILRHVQTMMSREPTMEISKPERPEDVWAVEQHEDGAKEIRNARSKCTCFPSKHCVDYNKVLKQYTSWRMTSDPSRSENLSSYLCTKSKVCVVPFGEGEGKPDLPRVQTDLLNLTRRCSMLQKQISQNCLNDHETNAELEAMESELAVREIEFKDILCFYNQLIRLKERVKSLRTQVERIHEQNAGDHQTKCPRPKRNPLRPTPSMAMAKVLKKIQGLQDKIKLIDAP